MLFLSILSFITYLKTKFGFVLKLKRTKKQLGEFLSAVHVQCQAVQCATEWCSAVQCGAARWRALEGKTDRNSSLNGVPWPNTKMGTENGEMYGELGERSDKFSTSAYQAI